MDNQYPGQQPWGPQPQGQPPAPQGPQQWGPQPQGQPPAPQGQSMRKVELQELPAGIYLAVEGEVEFSEIAALVDGEALRRKDDRLRQHNMYPIGKPHTAITISNAKDTPISDTRTIADDWVDTNGIYFKKDDATPRFQITNRSKFLPPVYQKKPDSNELEPVDLQGQELAKGLKVQLICQVYQPEKYTKKGLALRSIVVLEPIRYRGLEYMSQLGYVVKQAPKPVAPQQTAPAQQLQPQPYEAPVAQPQPYGAQPQAQPYEAPVAQPQPYGMQAQPQPYEAPVAQPQPYEPQPYGMQPQPQPYEAPAAQPQPYGVQPQPQPYEAPAAQPQPYGAQPQPQPMPYDATMMQPQPYGMPQTGPAVASEGVGIQYPPMHKPGE